MKNKRKKMLENLAFYSYGDKKDISIPKKILFWEMNMMKLLIQIS